MKKMHKQRGSVLPKKEITELFSGKKGDFFREPLFVIMLFLFFLSGICGLVYEVVWQKMLVFVFGITTYSTTIILSSFMGGMALGAYFLGRRTVGMEKPLSFYGLLEGGIGLYALIFPLLVKGLTLLFVEISHWLELSTVLLTGTKLILCFVLLMIPTFLMGGTLPVAGKVFIHRLDTMGKKIGLLYGINMVGAVIGSFLAGFILIPCIGMHFSVMIAAAVNLCIGATAIFYQRRIKTVEIQKIESAVIPKVEKVKPASQLLNIRLLKYVLVASALSGFAALSSEMLWNRTLIMYLQNSIYAFPTMLSTFLFGSALGSLIFSRWIDNPKYSLFYLGLIHLLIGLFIICSIVGFTKVTDMLVSIWKIHGLGFYPLISSGFVASLVIMFIPSLLMGVSFPLISKLVTRKIEIVGKSIGLAYMSNTLGCVTGVFIAGFVFIPLIGTTAGILLTSCVSMAIGVMLLLINPLLSRFVKGMVSGVFVLSAAAIFAFFIPRDVPLGLFSNNFTDIRQGGKLLYYKEGISGTVSVTQQIPHKFDSKVYKRIEVDGVSVAGNNYLLRTTQKIQGHVPLLLFKAKTGRDAENAFILGLGTGDASNCIVSHNIKRLDCLELCEAEINANTMFSDINNHILTNPKFHLHINDARNFLLTTNKTYDIIQSDAVHPDVAFNTYTREYYEICRDHLSKDGIFSAWIPLFNLDSNLLKSLLNTLHSVFPHISIWYASSFNNKHAIMVGSKLPITIDFQKFVSEMNEPLVKKSLAMAELNNPEDILYSYVGNEKTIAPLVKSFPINTDDNLLLPYSIPKQEQKGEANVAGNLEFFASISSPVESLLTNVPKDNPIFQKLAVQRKAKPFVYKGLGYYFNNQYQLAAQEYSQASAIFPDDKGIKYLLKEVEYFNYYYLGESLMNKNELQKSYELFQQSLEVNPGNFWSIFSIGAVLLRSGQYDQGILALKEALTISDYYNIHFWLGLAYIAQDKSTEGREEILKAKAMNPYLKLEDDLKKHLNINDLGNC
jgi:spermidine synthase